VPDPIELRRLADGLRAIKYTAPTGEDSSYAIAYTEGVAKLAADLFAQLGADAAQVGDTLRAAGVTGHSWEGRMVGEQRKEDRLNPVSTWLQSLLGPGYYRYSGEYQIDLQVPGGEHDTEDTGGIEVPAAVRDFLNGYEDPYDDELDHYRGIAIDDDGRPRLYLTAGDTWICAAIHPQHPDRICGAPTPCPAHPDVNPLITAGGQE
jgi:hypothetical protein